MTLKGKNVLITGAGRGIGFGIAKYLGEMGCNIGIHYNSSTISATSLCNEITDCGTDAITIKADLRNFDEIISMFDQFIARFKTIDVLINNAGITQYMPFLEATQKHFDLLTQLDFRGTYFCTQKAAQLMIKNETHGCIITVSSVQNQINMCNASVYSATKSAISKFTKCAALELAPYKIRVNCISPGFIKVKESPLTLQREKEQVARIPWHRTGQPREIGYLIGFLVDDKADYITGADFSIDGGLPLPAMFDNSSFPLPPPLPENLG